MILLKSKRSKEYLFIIIYRAINSILLSTYFDPDEHWQATEIAYRRVFGVGWETWEWKLGIRSYLYPLPFILFYSLLKLFNWHENDVLVVYGPKILASFTASGIDMATIEIADLMFGPNCRHTSVKTKYL